MRSHLIIRLVLSVSLLLISNSVFAIRKPRIPTGGRVAVIIDERLSALRSAPSLSGPLEQRLSRGRFVAIVGRRQSRDGIIYFDVKISRRTHGWVQAAALVILTQAAEDDRVLRLLEGSEDFDLISRARIFLNAFPRSRLRSVVLKLYAEAAEDAANKLSRDAARRLNHNEMTAGGAPEFSYYLNFNGLDRYNRQGVTFTFDSVAKRFHYDGAAWREILRRYPQSIEAAEARKRLDLLRAVSLAH